MTDRVSRRLVLAGFAGGAAALALRAGPAWANFSCAPFDTTGTQQCRADVALDAPAIAQQACRNWCWAAAVETCFAAAGHRVEQAKIVQKLSGKADCSTPPDAKMIDAVTGAWTDAKGKRFLAEGIKLDALNFGTWTDTAGAEAAAELANGNALICTALGHAGVLSAMSYMQNRAQRVLPLGFTVRDPWPGNPPVRKLGPGDVGGTGVLAAIRFS